MPFNTKIDWNKAIPYIASKYSSFSILILFATFFQNAIYQTIMQMLFIE